MMAFGWSKKDMNKKSLHESSVKFWNTGEFPTSVLTNKTEKNVSFSWKEPSKDVCGKVPVKSIAVDQSLCSASIIFLEQSNRIIARYGSDKFIILNFRKKVETAVVRKVLKDGVYVNDEEFHFVGCSSGGLKSRTCYMFKGSKDDVEQIWTECGAFSSIKSRYKRLKRIGLLFSSAVPTGIKMAFSTVTKIPDVETAKHNFTDGCGAVSLDLASKFTFNCKLSCPEKYVPSVFQIRYQGCKGVVAVDKTLKGVHLAIRPSMIKFDPGTMPFEEIWLCSYSRPYMFGYLNRQFITLLHSLGIKDEVFLRIQNEHFQRLENLIDNIEAAFEMLLLENQVELAMTCTNPDFLDTCRSKLAKIKSKALTKLEKLRIPILKSRNVFGVCDTTGTLQYGQCFIRITEKGGGKTIVGKVVVAKNPCYLLGDVRVLTAIHVKELEHLVDCIVFPIRGARPHPDEIAGSDLDGDQYFVCWDRDLVPLKTHTPYHYPSVSSIEPSGEITPEILIDLFAGQKNIMGKIDTYYKCWANNKSAGCNECQALGQLFSRSVDASKTGDVVSIPPNLIPLFLAEDKSSKRQPFIWDIMEEKAMEKKDELRQQMLSCEDLNVTLLTEDFILSFLDSENKISNVTEFQRLKLIFQWCNSFYSSAEVTDQKFKEMSKYISFGELTLEQQLCAVDLGIPLKEVMNALNHSILPCDLIKKFSLDDPYRRWRFYFSSSSSDFKWRNLLHGIQNYMESFLVIQLPGEITFVVHFLSKIKLGETNLDSGTVVTYFSSGCFDLNLQCALSSDFSIILDEDKLQIYRGNISATFIWLRNETPPKKVKMEASSQDILFDRISVDLTRFKRDILRAHKHPVVNKQSFLKIEMFVKTDSNIPAFLDYIEAGISGECVVENEPEMVGDIDCLPYDLITSQKQMLIDHTHVESEDDVQRILAYHAERGHVYNFYQTLEKVSIKVKVCDQLVPIFIDLLSTVVFKIGHEKILDKVKEVLVKIFFLFVKTKVSAMSALQIISYAARLELFHWIENILALLLKMIEATELTEYFDIIGNWELWYYIPSNISVRLFDHLYFLFFSLCDDQSAKASIDSDFTCAIKQQEVDKYSMHFSRLIQNHLLDEMFNLKGQRSSSCDSISTLVRMRCYNFVSLNEDVQENLQENELSGLKVGFNRPSNGIVSKSFTVGTFVLISIMKKEESTAPLTIYSKPIAIGRILKLCKQPADVVIELKHPVPHFLRMCVKDGVGHWELTLIGNVTLFTRSLSALKEIQMNGILSPLLSFLVQTHKTNCNKSYDIKDHNLLFPSHHLPTIKSDFNLNQQRAVTEALSRMITLIHGPPGTGKTHVACEIVSEQLVRNTEYPVLVVAETNMAVDNLCEKLLGLGIRVVRIGRLEQVSHAVRSNTLEGQIEKKRIQEGKDKSISRFLKKADIKPIFKAAQVVATTCTGAGDPCLKGMQFPFVIVDEATQVTEPTSLIPLVCGCQQLVLIGDPEQLAPSLTMKHKSLMNLDELSVTIFHRLQEIPSSESVFLNQQHRMHPKLVEFPSTQFYNGKLVTAESRLEQKSIFQENVPFIDSCNPQVFINCFQPEMRVNMSLRNPTEAQLLVTVIKYLIDSKFSSQQITVLTPYSGQLKCIQEECQTQKLSHVRIHTIDSFQGRESDIIIFSSVRCNSAHEIGFLDDRFRINVLLTRARHCVIGIGSEISLKNGSPLWKVWLSTVNVIEKSDFLKMIKGGAPKHQTAASSGPKTSGSSASTNLPMKSSSSEFKKSSIDHHPILHRRGRSRGGGWGQRGNHHQRSLEIDKATSNYQHSYDPDRRGVHGNYRGRGGAHYRASRNRPTLPKELSLGHSTFSERAHQVQDENPDNVYHRSTGRRKPYRGSGHPHGTN